jgi:hypothetical protein
LNTPAAMSDNAMHPGDPLIHAGVAVDIRLGSVERRRIATKSG